MDGVDQEEGASARPVESADAFARQLSDLPNLCPYLATTDGNWRSSSAVREHRCVAVSPPVPLAFEKQRRLCLLPAHVTCATYGAAVAARPTSATAANPRHRVIARTTPTVLDQTRFDLRLPAFRLDRISGQGLLVGVLVLAFAAVLIAPPGGGDGGSVNGTGTNPSAVPAGTAAAVATSPAASAAPHASVAASEAPVVTAKPIGSTAPAASTGPASSPASAQPTTSGATYKVKSGDTLTAIARRFGTTVKVLATLNHISDPSKLHVGQLLQLP